MPLRLRVRCHGAVTDQPTPALPAARDRHDQLAERGLALRDGDAIAWLSRRGFWCEPRGPLHLFADRLLDGPFELLRVWHTPARLGRTPDGRSGSRSETLLQIDGAVVLTSGSQSSTLGPGGVALLPSDGSWVLDGAVASARIEMRTRYGLWPSDVADRRIETLEAGSTAFREVLVATAISALSSSIHPGDQGFVSFRQAVESLMTGLPELLGVAEATTPEEALHRRALELIRKEAADPDLTVTTLAARLLVSRRHLYRAFAPHGATPLAEIHAARASLARERLDLHARDRAIGRHEIARRSGYRTVRAMNEALRTG